jgi:pimeloyl-ACP methyl ester carboxylesterase
MSDHFAETNGIRLHYLDHGDGPAILLLPGLSANAHAFDGLVAAGLTQGFRVIAPDLRGRGLSDHPASYSLAEHAADVLGLLDALGLEQVVLGGHSFGGLLTLYLAAQAPQRFAKLIVIDAALELASAATRAAIQPSLVRLGQTWDSWDEYYAAMQAASFYRGWWDPLLDNYYRADVRTNPDGSVQPRSHPQNIAAVMDAVIAADWAAIVGQVTLPVLLLHASGGYGPPGAPPVLDPAAAQALAARLPDCQIHQVPGNHMTMLFAAGARAIADLCLEFLATALGRTPDVHR